MKAQEHIGRKISQLREIKGMEQEELAARLGVTKPILRQIEESPTVEQDTLDRIAKILGVRVEEIKNFNSKSVTYISITNLYTSCTSNHNSMLNGVNIKPHFKTKNYQSLEPYRELYERLLRSEREKYELLMKKPKTNS